MNYVLLKNNQRYHFCGHPDFVVLEEEFSARQIVICTGEIQSMSDPDTQKSIYAVGSFMKHRSEQNSKPILCVNLFKEKWASLAIARLQRGAGPPNSVGKVTLKYCGSPLPINLKTDLKIFANRLYTQLRLLENT